MNHQFYPPPPLKSPTDILFIPQPPSTEPAPSKKHVRFDIHEVNSLRDIQKLRLAKMAELNQFILRKEELKNKSTTSVCIPNMVLKPILKNRPPSPTFPNQENIPENTNKFTSHTHIENARNNNEVKEEIIEEKQKNEKIEQKDENTESFSFRKLPDLSNKILDTNELKNEEKTKIENLLKEAEEILKNNNESKNTEKISKNEELKKPVEINKNEEPIKVEEIHNEISKNEENTKLEKIPKNQDAKKTEEIQKVEKPLKTEKILKSEEPEKIEETPKIEQNLKIPEENKKIEENIQNQIDSLKKQDEKLSEKSVEKIPKKNENDNDNKLVEKQKPDIKLNEANPETGLSKAFMKNNENISSQIKSPTEFIKNPEIPPLKIEKKIPDEKTEILIHNDDSKNVVMKLSPNKRYETIKENQEKNEEPSKILTEKLNQIHNSEINEQVKIPIGLPPPPQAYIPKITSKNPTKLVLVLQKIIEKFFKQFHQILQETNIDPDLILPEQAQKIEYMQNRQKQIYFYKFRQFCYAHKTWISAVRNAFLEKQLLNCFKSLKLNSLYQKYKRHKLFVVMKQAFEILRNQRSRMKQLENKGTVAWYYSVLHKSIYGLQIYKEYAKRKKTLFTKSCSYRERKLFTECFKIWKLKYEKQRKKLQISRPFSRDIEQKYIGIRIKETRKVMGQEVKSGYKVEQRGSIEISKKY